MNYPKEVLDIIRERTLKHLSDIDRAVSESKQRIRKLSSFDSFVEAMYDSAIRVIAHDIRLQYNNAARKAANAAGVPGVFPSPKVKVYESAEAMNCERTIYEYRIGGTILGKLYGSECKLLAVKEHAESTGHLANGLLLDRLAEIVPEKKRVEQAISQKRLWKLFCDTQRLAEEEAA